MISSRAIKYIVVNAALTVFLFGAQTNAFVPALTPSHSAARPGITQVKEVGDATGFDSFSRAKDVAKMTSMPVGEAQRPFRRTVYGHDDWKKHRSQDRFFYYLLAIFKSGVYRNINREVAAVALVATAVVVFNGLTGGYVDFEGVKHAAIIPGMQKIGLPLAAFTITSPSLGLLLVFRTNSAYQRWDEARKNWGMNINHTRDLVRMANCYYDSSVISPEVRQYDLDHVALCTWTFVRCMKRHLSPEEEDEAAFRNELYEKLPPQQAEMIISATHRPNRALQDLSFAIDDLPMHFMRKNEIHRAVTIFEDDLGSSERILTSPVPLFYTRHLARYLGIWLLLLPLGMYDTFNGSWNNIAMIPSVIVISTMLFGIEEIGTQLEEPFTVLPMQAFCDKIYNWCTEIVSWSPGDYGRPMRQAKPEHMAFNTEIANANGYEPVPTPAATQYAPAPEPVVTQAAAPVPPAPQAPPAPAGASIQDLNAQWASASRGQQ
jgi:putative membrane protein